MVSAQEQASPKVVVTVPNREQTALNRQIIDDEAFTGHWQTYLEGNRLMIPSSYHHLLRMGGVVAPDQQDHALLLFGRVHWLRITGNIAAQLGLDPYKHDVAEKIYGNKHLLFDKLNEDGSITLSAELISHARLTRDVAISGKIYYAYMTSPVDEHDKLATDRDWGRLGDALL